MRPTCPCGASWPRRPAGRCSRSAPARAASRSTWRAPATTSRRSTSSRRCWPRSRARADGVRRPDRRRRRPRLRPRPALRAHHRPDADDPAAAGARRLPAPPRARTWRRAACSRWPSPSALETFEAGADELPAPDVGTAGGWRFASQPTAVRVLPDATRIERRRVALGPGGAGTDEVDVIELARVTVGGLEAEGAAAGLRPEPHRSIAPTDAARRLRGGAAAWLTRRCACARSIPT